MAAVTADRRHPGARSASTSGRGASGSRSRTRPARSRRRTRCCRRGRDHAADHRGDRRASPARPRRRRSSSACRCRCRAATGPAATGRARRDRRAARRRRARRSRSSLHDERLTTVTAERALGEARSARGATARQVVDKVAAAVMLQSWLESGRTMTSSARTRRHRRRAATLDRRHRRRVWAVVLMLVVVPLAASSAVVASWFWWQLDPPGKPGRDGRGARRRRLGRLAHRRRARRPRRDRFVASCSTSTRACNGDTDFQAGTYDLQHEHGRAATRSPRSKPGPRIDYVELAVPPGLWLQRDRGARRRAARPQRASRSSRRRSNNAVRSEYRARRASTTSRGCCGPTRTASPTPRTRSTSSADDGQRSSTSTPTRSGSRPRPSQGRTPYDILTIASLIEAEAKVDEDRPLIASVIYNRLREDMPLQIDATVLYARGDPDEADDHRRRPRAIDSPYNTYAHDGLPPTPIGSVSDASLQAALRPAQTDYLYYVRRGTRTATTRSPTTGRGAPAQHRGGARGRPAVISGAHAARRRSSAIPVRHSLSPRAAQHRVRARSVSTGSTSRSRCPTATRRAALDAVRALGLVGLSVTMPHKTAAADALRRADAPTPPRCTASTP